jgi:hypothetical protein
VKTDEDTFVDEMLYDIHGAEAAQDWVIQPHTATVLLNSLRGRKLLPATIFVTV